MAQPGLFLVLMSSLILLALSQSLLLLMLGPFLKAFFLVQSEMDKIRVATILPNSLTHWFSTLAHLEIQKSQLTIVIPTLLIFAGSVRSLASYFYNQSILILALYQAKVFRDRLFLKILSQSYLEISSRAPAQWMSLIMHDVLLMQLRFSDIMSALLRDVTLIFAAFFTMLIIHWPTALLLLIGAPLLAKNMGRLGKRIATFTGSFQKEQGKIAQLILELRDRFALMSVSKGQAYEMQRFQSINERYYQNAKGAIFSRAFYAPSLELTGFLIFATLLAIYAKDAHNGIGLRWILFWTTLAVMLKPLRNLGEQLARLHETLGALEDAFSILEKDAKSLPEPRAFQKLASDLSIAKIEVTYNHSDPVFLATDLKIKRGQAILVIGESGSGKSSFLKTLAGLIEPSSFAANLPLSVIRECVSYVPQSPFLFNENIRENIGYGQLNKPSDQQITQVLEALDLDKIVMERSGGLDKILDPMALNLSGGQIQRLVIARALLAPADFYLMDEAASALDRESEKRLIDILVGRCHQNQATLLLTSHRLEHLAKFDAVMFVQKGRIAGFGKHQDLVSTNADYRFFCGMGPVHANA